MADIDPVVDIHVDVGETFACQIYWTDQYDDPIEIAHPMKMTVAMQTPRTYISSSESPGANQYAYLTYNSATGFIQLSLPSSHTQTMTPGLYAYDLFVHVYDPDDQNATYKRQKLFGGSFVVRQGPTTF
jgi:hypothetical protein